MTDKFETFRTGFCTTQSGDGNPKIVIEYPSLSALRKAHDELISALSLPVSNAGENAELSKRFDRMLEDVGGSIREAAQGVVDWADFALANPKEFDSHGVKNLDGPAFDKLRAALAATANSRAEAIGVKPLEWKAVRKAVIGADGYEITDMSAGNKQGWRGSFPGENTYRWFSTIEDAQDAAQGHYLRALLQQEGE